MSILTRIELYRRQVWGYFEGEHFDSYRAIQTPSVGYFEREHFNLCMVILRVSILTCIELYRCQVFQSRNRCFHPLTLHAMVNDLICRSSVKVLDHDHILLV